MKDEQNPNKTFAHNKKQQTNSSEVCHSEVEVNVGFSGVRRHTSIRCDSKLWKSFKSVCENNGISTCDVLEKLILGFTVGYSTRVAQPTTIYVTVDAPRVVKRVRRKQLVYESEFQVHCCDVTWCMSKETKPLVDLEGKMWHFCKKHVAQPLNQGFKLVEGWNIHG